MTFNSPPDYENPTDATKENAYLLTISADTADDSKTEFVRVTVTNVNEPPAFDSNTATRSIAENTAAGQNIGAPVAATDPDAGATLTYTLGGTDAASFAIVATSGQLQTKTGQTYDYETKSSYSVTVTVKDTANASATQNVTITLTNVDEPGTVTLSTYQPSARTQITATLTDPDGSITGTTWRWDKSSNGNTGWSSIGTDSNTYTPPDGDIGSFLRATASYTDGHGSGKTAQATTTQAVGVGANRAPDFDETTASRSFPENAAVGHNIGSPITATDDDRDTLTYTLEGTDKDSFQIVSTSGQIQTKSGVTYDHETKPSYSVTVKADDKKGGTDTIDVTITVTDANEAPVVSGETTVNHPENDSGTVATYSATDQDGTTSFTWTLSGDDAEDFSITGGALTFDPAPNYEAAADKDTNNVYLVTVEASDGTAKGTRDVTVTVTDINEPPAFDSNTATRSIAENTAAGQNIGAPVAATDPERDTLTYSLGGTDAVSFAIVATSGQLQTRAALNEETKKTYTVTVSVRDSKDSSGNADTATDDTITVTITVTDVNEPPAFDSNTATRSIAENTAAGQNIGAPVAATDPERDTLTYSLGGTDAASFAIVSSSGQLQTKTGQTYDYEAKSSYSVTVTVKDTANASATQNVTITLTNVDEPGTVTLSTYQPSARTQITATLTDPDGSATGKAWQWTKSNDGNTWTNIGTDSDSYSPSDAEMGYSLRATVTYTDPQGSGKTAQATTTQAVRSGTNRAPDFGATNAGRQVVENTGGGVNIGSPVTATDDDRDTLTYTLEGTDKDSFQIVSTSGQIQTKSGVTYDHETKPSYSVTVKADDKKGGTDTIGVTIAVTDANDKPAFDAETATREVSENTATNTDFGAPVEATDQDNGDTLTYSLDTAGALVFDIDTSTGQLKTKAALDKETKATHTVTVSVRDSKDSSGNADTATDDTITVTITVTDVNEPPEFDSNTTTRSIAENTAAGQNIGAPVAATDPERDTLTYSLSGTDAASFAIMATSGQLQTRAALDEETKNTYTVTVSVRDSKDSSGNADTTTDDTITVTITVADVNEPPEFDSNTATRSTAENTVAGQDIGAPVAATDPDTGDTLVYALGGADANSFDIDTSTGQLKTKAMLNKEAKATYTVTVSVKDGKNDQGVADTSEAPDDTVTVTITVTDVNEPPEFDDGDRTARRVSEAAAVGQNIGTPVAATDPDADATLTYTLGGTDAASFVIVATSGQLKTRAALDKETKDTYTVTVSVRDSKDSSGNADTATDDTVTVTITVTDANDAPVVSGNTTVNHPENDSSTVATYTATDQDGTTDFTWTLSGDDAGDFSITGGALTFDPAPNYEAAADKDTNNVYLVTVEASDGTAKGTRDVTVTVTDVDEDGEITFSSIQPQAGTGLVATLADDDIVVSIESWHWEISSDKSSWNSISEATTGTYVPLDDDVGKYLRVTATYTDGHGSGKTATATTTNMVEEEPTSNEGPLFSTDTAQRSIAENTAAGQNIGTPVAATDPESDTLTYSLEGTDAASFDIVPATGQLQTKDALDYEVKNSYTVTVTAADPSLDSDTITVTITVTDVNEPPEFNDGDSTARRVSEAATAGQDIGAPVAATDPDAGATLTYTLGGTDAASFDIVATSGQLQTRAALDKETEDTYSVTVSVRDSKDSSGVADTATDDTITVTITVTDANDAPVVSGDATVNHPENDSGTVATYTATDQDGTPTTFTWTLSGDDAEDFSITGGALTFDPAPNYEAAADKDTNNVYLVTVEASDGTAKGTRDVTVTVTDVNEPPEFDDGDQTARRVSEAATAGQNIGAPVAATDPERDTLTYSLGGTDAASFAIVATSGQLQTRAALDKETKDTYTVTVSVRDSKDSSGVADTATDDTITVTITVTGANGPPVISRGPRSGSNKPINYPENSRETVARHSHHDPENDPVTWLLSGTDSGDFSINSAGDLTFRSAPDYESPADSNKNNEYRVTVNANDGNGGSDSTHVTVNVTNVEETGTVTLSPTQALIGAQLTATLADPDGSVTSFTWSWEISSDKSSWNSISGATSATYTPVAGDLGKHLRAKVSYTDGHGSGKTAYSAPTGAVRMSNRPPAFPGSGSGKPQTRTVAENTPAGRSIGAPVAATDPDASAGDSLTYTLGGGDAASFAVVATSGQLQTRAALDYETRSSYTVTVTATDLSNASDSITVNIQVADVDETGTVTLSSAWPRAGAALTASLSDPDAPVTAMSWQWASATTATGSFGDISGATSSAYTPVAGDLGKYLRATVAYTDRHGSGKRAQKVSGNPVIEARVNAAPDFGSGTAVRSIPENTPAGRIIGAPVTASDPDPGDSLTYTLGGTDAASFAIVATSGQLRTRAALDYETRNSYTVTVAATDQFDARDTISVTITVTDVDPPGKPGTPTVAAASVGGHNALSVTWTAPAGTAISGYNMQYRAGTGAAWSGIPRSVSGTAVTIPGLIPGTTYQVRVRAYNSEGTGPWSDPGQGGTAARQQRNILRSAGSGGVLSPVCTPSIGFRTGIPWSFTAARGGENPPDLLLEVWDRELCGMNFRVSSGAKWLSISPALGMSEGAHDQNLIRISADISGLDVGTHTATIQIAAPKSGNSPQSVSVSLTITEPAPPEPSHCQEHTVIESSDGALRVVVPSGSAPCDTGITVESLDADSRKTLEGKSVDVVRVGKVSAVSADSGINAGLWALLPGDRVSACEEGAAAVYHVDGDSWDPLTHRCEMDEQGRAWTVSPLTGFGVYVVTLPAPSVESGIAGEVQLQTPEAAGTTISPGTPSPEMTASNGSASSINAVEAQPTPAPTLDVTHVEVRHTPAPGPDVVYADDSAAGLWADLPPEELGPPVGETGQSPPRRLGSLGIFLYIIAPIIVIIALLLIMFGVRCLRGAESASP